MSQAERHTVWGQLKPKQAPRDAENRPEEAGQDRALPLGPGRVAGEPGVREVRGSGPGSRGAGGSGGQEGSASARQVRRREPRTGAPPELRGQEARGSWRRCLARGSCVCEGSGRYLPVSIATAAAIASKGAKPPPAQPATARKFRKPRPLFLSRGSVGCGAGRAHSGPARRPRADSQGARGGAGRT